MKLAVLAAVGLLTLTGCGSETKKSAPDPAPGHTMQLTQVRTIQQPNGFRNIIFGCMGHKGVYTSSRGGDFTNNTTTSSITVVKDDPDCSNEPSASGS